MANALRVALHPTADIFCKFKSPSYCIGDFSSEVGQANWKWTNQPRWKFTTGKPLCRIRFFSCIAFHNHKIFSLVRRGFLWRLVLLCGVQRPGCAGEGHSEHKENLPGNVGDLCNTVEVIPSADMEYLYRGGPGGNEALVTFLQRNGILKSERVASAMKDVDRGLFVPAGQHAYVDSPQPIGHNATISAPHMHACCLDLLESHLRPGMKCLDVGSGTGYLTAVMGILVGESGRAVGIEHISELVAKSKQDVGRSKAAHLLEKGVISLHCGDGRLGWPSEQPYDAIHVGAAASTIPQALLDQLKPGGRMVIPVGDFFQDLRVVDKRMDGTLQESTNTQVRYVPLTSREAQLQGF